MRNYTWMPINIHRIIANVAFGGSVAAAYAAFKFLGAKTDEERAHYDWMGYIGNFVAICAFLPLPFAGYWLAKEIYAYSQTLGLTMMGGAFSWLFIIQAVLIGNLFLAANYYLWLGMGRIDGAEQLPEVHQVPAHPGHHLLHGLGDAALDHLDGLRGAGDGRPAHPALGFLGVMSAKNTAVNILILTTFLSFLLYRRSGKIADRVVGEARQPRAVRDLRWSPRRSSSSSASTATSSRPGCASASRSRRCCRCSSRWSSVTVIDVFLFRDAQQDGRGALGPDRADLAVRADLPRRHLHLADGPDGLRALGPAPALARLRRHPRHLGRRLHADAGLRHPDGLGDRAALLPAHQLRLLAGQPAGKKDWEPQAAGDRARGRTSPRAASPRIGEAAA